MDQIKNCCYVYFLALVCVSLCQSAIYNFECVDTMEDAERHGWEGGYSYVNSSEELKAKDLKGKLNATGIFYLEGPQLISGIYKKGGIGLFQPAYVYLKYSSFLKYPDTPQYTIFAGPSLTSEIHGFYEYLNATHNLIWTEHLFPLHSEFVLGQFGRPGIGVMYLWQQDYFFVDKIILVYGYPDNGIAGIRDLC